jgi:LacI family transcriptional regulator
MKEKAPMATIKDIAKVAGVSQGAVSRILNNDATLSVSAATRERVITAANEMGYKSVAERYKKSRAGGKAEKEKEINVGIAQMFDMDELREDIYYMVMKNALDSVAFTESWNTEMLLRDSDGKFVKHSQHKLDGIIAIGRFTDEEIEDFKSYSPNIVFIDSSPDDMKYYSVTPNYHMAVRQALTRFSEKGFRDVAYVGAVYTYDSHKQLSMDPRYYYYRNSMALENIFSEDMVIDCGRNNSNSAYAAMNKYLDEHEKPPRAMFISSDAAAPGVVKAIQERGFTIPEDVSIITYNNTTLSEACNPPLDSIEVYMMEHASAAVESLHKTWENNSIPKRIMVPCSLVERGSIINN